MKSRSARTTQIFQAKNKKRTRVERVTSLVLGSNGQRQVEELEMLRKGRMLGCVREKEGEEVEVDSGRNVRLWSP